MEPIMTELAARPLEEKVRFLKAYVVQKCVPTNLTYMDWIGTGFTRTVKRDDGIIEEEKRIYPSIFEIRSSVRTEDAQMNLFNLLCVSDTIKYALHYLTGLVQMQQNDMGKYNPTFIDEVIKFKTEVIDKAEAPPSHLAFSIRYIKEPYQTVTYVTTLYFYPLTEPLPVREGSCNVVSFMDLITNK